MRNLYGVLIYDDTTGTNTFTVNAASTRVLDIDLDGANNAQLLLQSFYATTSGTTGLSVTVKYGFGEGNPLATGTGANQVSWKQGYCGPLPCVLDGTSTAVFGDNSDSITMATTTPSSTNVTTRTAFSLNDLRINVPRWIRLTFTNNDAGHAATVKVYMDI